MLYCQLAESMWLRPKRGRVFYGIAAFSAAIFILSTVSIGGQFRFAEMIYIENRTYQEGPKAWYQSNSDRWENVMTMSSIIAIPWIGDLLMLYRVHVLWNCRWWMIFLPCLIYLSNVAISLPFLVALSRPHDPEWSARVKSFSISYTALMVAFNLLVTILISVRLLMLRRKIEQVLGKVQSMYYNCHATIFVECGGFFSLWITFYLIVKARGSWIQDAILLPSVYVSAITRIMIILRMAQNNAWSRDLIVASSNGVLDWQVSSAHSIPLHSQSNQDAPSFPDSRIKNLPSKFRDDSESL